MKNETPEQKTRILTMVVLALIGALAVQFVWMSGWPHPQTVQSDRPPLHHITADWPAELQSDLGLDPLGRTFEGIVKNTSGRYLDFVMMRIVFYDKDGAIIGNHFPTFTAMPPDFKWKIDVRIEGLEPAKSFLIKGVFIQ